MFKIIFLFTSSIGLVTTILLLLKAKTNAFFNKYLILSFSLITLKFFFLGIRDIFFSKYLSDFDIITNLPGLLIIILNYLYFKDLINKKEKSKSNDFLHFVVFFLFYVFTLLNHQGILHYSINYSIGLFVIYFLFYLVKSFLLLKNKLWVSSRNVSITNKRQTILINWTKFLFLCMVFVFIRLFVEIVNYNLNNSFQHLAIFSIIPCILASFLFIKVIITPEIIYGQTFLANRVTDLKKKDIGLNNIWIKKLTINLANVQENSLREIIFNNLDNYISELELIEFSIKNYGMHDFKIMDLSNLLAIPKSHLAFLFKHHCTLSFSDYKKAIRISKAIQLIEEGYLKTNTIESLAMIIGFSSYSPFYTSFKTNTGFTPQEYNFNKEKIVVL